MDICERRTGTTAVLQLSGRLTVNDRPGMLKDRVALAVQDGVTRVLLDLSGVVYIDSTRLGELIAAHITVSRSGGRLGLVATPRRILELIAMAGLDGVFEQFASPEEAGT